MLFIVKKKHAVMYCISPILIWMIGYVQLRCIGNEIHTLGTVHGVHDSIENLFLLYGLE